MKLKDKVALVTGSGRGIGKAIAKTLSAEGAEIVLTARTLKEITQVQKEIEEWGGKAMAIPADLTKDAELVRLFS
ncbi:MAG TPA: SDR family NAD(P)-dependent oxidoreductase, partial [Bacteroidota bacterium]|nr:SDR family NAD(P)-dependent oxidoreductase [Bacteroidota bacterium]